MIDVLIVGAGPAGSVAALCLARAGARVLLVDRARFPRPKLCGDTLNPGTVDILARLGLQPAVAAGSIPIDGMILTGERGASVRGTYPCDRRGLAIRREELDMRLLSAAVAAGVQFEEGVAIREPLVEETPHGPIVRGGTMVGDSNGPARLRATVTIAADGRRSRLAFALGLARHPAVPRRWAIGRYFEGVRVEPSYGEMHVRRHRYIGVASVPDGAVNVCLVTTDRRGFADPGDRLRWALAADPVLAPRFAGARPIGAASVIGPLAVDVLARAAGMPGLLLAGDAAGFIDPMTGDGLRFAIRGAELAAEAALDVLQRGVGDAHIRLARRRRAEFSPKWRFNRAVRALVGSPAGVALASIVTPAARPVLRRFIAFAGDVQAASQPE